MMKFQHPMDDIDAIARLLPPFPKVVLQLLELLRHEEASFELMARLIRNDPVLSGNILAMANHIRRLHVQSDLTDPFAAVSLIGVNRVRKIVVSTGMNRFIQAGSGSEFLFHHSLAVAITTQELAMMCDVTADEAYVVGILHDIGQLCFQVLDDEAFQKVCHQAALDGQILERETKIFGIDHCQMGARLAQHWNLPDHVVSAIRTHHHDTIASRNLQAVVCLGETLARALDLPSSSRNHVLKINTPAVELIGIKWDSPEMLDCYGRCRARFMQVTSSI